MMVESPNIRKKGKIHAIRNDNIPFRTTITMPYSVLVNYHHSIMLVLCQCWLIFLRFKSSVKLAMQFFNLKVALISTK